MILHIFLDLSCKNQLVTRDVDLLANTIGVKMAPELTCMLTILRIGLFQCIDKKKRKREKKEKRRKKERKKENWKVELFLKFVCSMYC